MTFPTQILWRGALAAGVLVGLTALSTDALAGHTLPVLSKDQGKCSSTMGKDAQKVMASQGKDYKSCFKDESKAKLLTSVAFCVESDPKGKVQGGLDKLAADAAGTKCQLVDKNGETKEPPFAMSSDATQVGAGYTGLHPALWRDLLGADPGSGALVHRRQNLPSTAGRSVR